MTQFYFSYEQSVFFRRKMEYFFQGICRFLCFVIPTIPRDPWKFKVDEDGNTYWHNVKTGEKKYGAEKPVSKHMAMAQNLGYGAFMAIVGLLFVKLVWMPSSSSNSSASNKR